MQLCQCRIPTCVLAKKTKSQAKMVVFELTEKRPIIQVIPSRGIRVTAPPIVLLK